MFHGGIHLGCDVEIRGVEGGTVDKLHSSRRELSLALSMWSVALADSDTGATLPQRNILHYGINGYGSLAQLWNASVLDKRILTALFRAIFPHSLPSP